MPSENAKSMPFVLRKEAWDKGRVHPHKFGSEEKYPSKEELQRIAGHNQYETEYTQIPTKITEE